MQERSKNLTQSVLKIKKTISDAQDRTMNEPELKLLEKQLDQIIEKYVVFRNQVEENINQYMDCQLVVP